MTYDHQLIQPQCSKCTRLAVSTVFSLETGNLTLVCEEHIPIKLPLDVDRLGRDNLSLRATNATLNDTVRQLETTQQALTTRANRLRRQQCRWCASASPLPHQTIGYAYPGVLR
jgi:hypothetical protein